MTEQVALTTVTLAPSMCERLLAAHVNYKQARDAWKEDPFNEEKIEAHARSITELADLAGEIACSLEEARAQGLYVSPTSIN